jgi:hypothetical protein
MGQDMASIDLAPVIVDDADQTESISQDVEYGESINLVCMLYRRPHVAEPVPFRTLDELDPDAERSLELTIDNPGFAQLPPGYQVHRRLRHQSPVILLYILRRSSPLARGLIAAAGEEREAGHIEPFQHRVASFKPPD